MDDPDDDWAPFQKLEPRLLATGEVPGSGPANGSQTDEEDFSVPPLLESETIWSLAFSPCGQYLASGGDNGGIRLWARSTGGSSTTRKWHEVAHVRAHDPRACFALAWQRMASETTGGDVKGRLVSGGGDGKVVVWELVSAACST